MEVKCSHCDKEYDLEVSLLGRKAKCEDCKQEFVITEYNKAFDKDAGDEEEVVYEKEDDIEIKPHFWSFILFSLGLLSLFIKMTVTIIIVLAIFMFGISILTNTIAGGDESSGAVLLLATLEGVHFFQFFALGLGGALFLGFVLKYIQYKKESYIITDRKIIYNYGTLFSENSVDLSLDKVTQVNNILGFWQHLIFKTGNIVVKTAGSSNSTVRMKNINLSEEHYITVKERMKKNGFRLEIDKLVQEEKPHWLAIVGELFGKVFWVMLFLIYMGYNMYLGFQEGMQEEDINLEEITAEFSEEFAEVGDIAVMGGIGFVGIVLVFFIVLAVFKYLDLSRRRYRIFTDTVTYNEGFLTKNFSFIPMENVADTENTQSFWSKIFGLHDVEISSQGENNKVVFKNMVNGEKIMANVKYLKNAIIKKKSTIVGEKEVDSSSLIGYQNRTEKPLNFNKEFQEIYKMSALKTIISIMPILIFPPAFFVVLIHKVIQISATSFILGESSIEKRFEFINTKHNNFSVEKITGVSIRESILDRMLGTCSIKFLSIGTGTNIVFKDIKKVGGLERNILEKVGIQLDEVQKEIISEFNLKDYIKSGIGKFLILISTYILSMLGVLLFGISFPEVVMGDSLLEGSLEMIYYAVSALFGVIALLILLRFFYSKFYYSPVRYKNRIYTEALESIQGFFIKTKKYSLLRHIKGVQAKKYPLTQTGDFSFDVSGETTTQVQQGNKFKQFGILSLLMKKNYKTIINPNAISIKFLKNVFEEFDTQDTIVNEAPLNTEVVQESTQDIGNSIVGMVILYTIVMLGFVGVTFLDSTGDIDVVGMYIVMGVITCFFAVILGFKIWFIKVKRYEYQKSRVLFYSGIIYKKRHSILYSNFNYAEKGRGFLNMLFRNGNINIYTLGSSGVDMNIKDVDNFKEVYELLKKD